MRSMNARKPAKTSAAIVPLANFSFTEDGGDAGGNGCVVLPLFVLLSGDPLDGGNELVDQSIFSNESFGLERIKEAENQVQN